MKRPRSTESGTSAQTYSPSPTEHELDDYEPEGEWNIDGTGITAEDLLDEGSNQNIVHLARLHPRKVLVGEEE